MPLTDRPYQTKLFHALNIYRDVMRKFIIGRLDSSPAATMDSIRNSLWDSAVEQFDKNFRVEDDLETAIDVGWFRAIVEGNWNSVFNAEFIDAKGRILSDLDLISDIRNKVVHPKKHDINRPEALNALETIEHILRSLNALVEADTVRRLCDDNSNAQVSPIPEYMAVSPAEVQRIADAVAQRVEPLVERVQTTVDLTEEMKQTLGKQVANELTSVMDSIQSVQGGVAEEIVGRIKPLVGAQQESTQQQMTSQAAEEINETLIELIQEFRVLEARVTDALPTPVNTSPPPSFSTKSTSLLPMESVAPSSIADMWLGVIDELRIIKVGEFSLGALLRGCRPIDVWIQRNPEKLILTFRNDFHLRSMQKVSKDPRGREAVEKAIANNFGRALEFECILDNPLPF